ncbi:dihydrodipicolinate synthase family protein [Halomonas sp. PAMB 3232]|uniref:dihydrodipicolinate synthase family protein n=1 Tax=Halomonas sp. PAMB 3232 TaxID=3075221 RepID=UPI00289C4021|nr:dihydrodipicolinate synthase family protein [Halomonas sp. PAMB 3232]WNL39991.1 dihydrodipicolinate synthase family protein [Halomonas sp. PAMB 3232]
MFTGLSAFPLTPMSEQGVRDDEFVGLVKRLAAARVDSIGVLGSTGNYMYLTREQRARVIQLAVENAEGVPVVAGIGALATREVIALAEDAQKAGASGVLLAPVSYQKLTDDEVFDHYQTVCASIDVPLCVYDNPGTTHFSFSDELHGRIAELPQVASIKIPPVAGNIAEARARIERLRALIPKEVTLGISGDPVAAVGLCAGCQAWYSVLGGLFPERAMAITRAAQSGDRETALTLSSELEPFWALYREHGGSLRVTATVAEVLGVVSRPSLPMPLKTLQGEARRQVEQVIERL